MTSLHSQLHEKMASLLQSFTPEEAKAIGSWFGDNFRVQSPKTPKGQKALKDLAEKFRWWLVAGAMHRGEIQRDQIIRIWAELESQVGNLVRYFSDEGGVVVPPEMKIGSRLYLNKIGFEQGKLAKYVASLEKLFDSVQGWRKAAFTGTLKVALAGPNDFRGTAGGVYKSAEDTLYVRATPAVLARSGGTYGALDYILIHELGHRYERKAPLPEDFDKSRWWTSKYSRNDGESFAELFALGHFRMKADARGTWAPEIQERFEALMQGRDIPRNQGKTFDEVHPGLAQRIAAKYQKKKEVPKATGKGTVTVYEYSERQIATRNRDKAERIEKLRHSIDDLRTQVQKDLKSKEEHTRNVALAVGLLDLTYERVGNETSADEGHVGVTGWQVKHLTVGKDKVTIKYVGKSGVKHEKVVDKASSVAAIKKAIEGKKDNDLVCGCSAEDVNEYLKPFDVTAKDLRGFHANSTMQGKLKSIRSKGGKLPEEKKAREKKLKAEWKKALKETAEEVGHEPSTLENQYLVPGLRDEFMADGSVTEKLDKKGVRTSSGDWVLNFFRRHPALGHYAKVKVIRPAVGSGSGSDPEASVRGGVLYLFPKFWTLGDQKAMDFVFAHEIGHWVLGEYSLSNFTSLAASRGVNVWEDLPFSQHNMDEAFADAFASYYTDGDVKRRYPEWADLVGAVEGKITPRETSLDKTARKVPVSKELIQSLRKDFLTLVSNVPRIDNYQTALKWRTALLRWHTHLENVVTQIREDLEAKKRGHQLNESMRSRNLRLENPEKSNEAWAEYYLTHMKPLWDFAYEVRRLDIPSLAYLKQYQSWVTEDQQFENLKEPLRKWNTRVRTKAVAAWKWLEEYQAWTLRTDFHGGGGDPTVIHFREEEPTEIGGVKVIVVGFDASESLSQEGLKKTEAGLRLFKQRASQVYPWLLQHLLPIRLEFTGKANEGAAGTYEGDHIDLTFWAIHSEPKRFVQTLAHEMGHHIFKTVLSDEAIKAWHLMIRGGDTPLDLRDVVAQMRSGETIWDLEKRIENEDPVLKIQLETLYHDPRFKGSDLFSLKSIQEYLEAGKDPIVHVPIKPITGYASKNTEEAFCEVLGLLVGYGPRTLDPEIVSWFKALVPGVRIASRIAGRWLAATKTQHEKDDEAIEALSKPAPKSKPPRHDLRRERVPVEDKDTQKPSAENDRDLSMNYKKRSDYRVQVFEESAPDVTVNPFDPQNVQQLEDTLVSDIEDVAALAAGYDLVKGNHYPSSSGTWFHTNPFEQDGNIIQRDMLVTRPDGAFLDDLEQTFLRNKVLKEAKKEYVPKKYQNSGMRIAPPRPKPPKPPKLPPQAPMRGRGPVPSEKRNKHKPGDVWESEEEKGTWVGLNPEGVAHSFEDKEKAQAYAKGKSQEEDEGEKGGEDSDVEGVDDSRPVHPQVEKDIESLQKLVEDHANGLVQPEVDKLIGRGVSPEAARNQADTTKKQYIQNALKQIEQAGLDEKYPNDGVEDVSDYEKTVDDLKALLQDPSSKKPAEKTEKSKQEDSGSPEDGDLVTREDEPEDSGEKPEKSEGVKSEPVSHPNVEADWAALKEQVREHARAVAKAEKKKLIEKGEDPTQARDKADDFKKKYIQKAQKAIEDAELDLKFPVKADEKLEDQDTSDYEKAKEELEALLDPKLPKSKEEEPEEEDKVGGEEEGDKPKSKDAPQKEKSKTHETRKYSDKELENESGEFFENPYTGALAPDFFADQDEAKEKIQQAPTKTVGEDWLKSVGNSNVEDILNEPDLKKRQSLFKDMMLEQDREEDYNRLVEAFENGTPLPAPIVLQDEAGNLSLLGGNSRLVGAAAFGIQMPVKVLQYKGKFDPKAAEEAAQKAGEEPESGPEDSDSESGDEPTEEHENGQHWQTEKGWAGRRDDVTKSFKEKDEAKTYAEGAETSEDEVEPETPEDGDLIFESDDKPSPASKPEPKGDMDLDLDGLELTDQQAPKEKPSNAGSLDLGLDEAPEPTIESMEAKKRLLDTLSASKVPGLKSALADLSDEDVEVVSKGFDEHSKHLRKMQSEGLLSKKDMASIARAKDDLGEESLDGLGRRLAEAHFATELSDPSKVAGRSISETPLSDADLNQRTKESYEQYQNAGPEIRKAAMNNIAEQMEQFPSDSTDPVIKSKRQEYERILDGLHLAAAMKGEACSTGGSQDGDYSEGFELRPPMHPRLVKMAWLLNKQGKAHTLVQTGDTRNTPQNMKMYAEIISNLGDRDLLKLAGDEDERDSPIALTAESIKDSDLSWETRENLKKWLCVYLVQDMLWGESLAQGALEKSDMTDPDVRKKKSDRALKKPKVSPQQKKLIKQFNTCLKAEGFSVSCRKHLRQIEHENIASMLENIEKVIGKIPVNNPAKAQIKAYQEAETEEEKDDILDTLFTQKGAEPLDSKTTGKPKKTAFKEN